MKRLACAVTLLSGAVLAPADVRAGPLAAFTAMRAEEQILALDLDEAAKTLSGEGGDDPLVLREKGRLALYRDECDAAAIGLSRPELAMDEQAGQLADIARGCARVSAATLVRRDEARAVVVRFQDDGDEALFPFIVETVVAAREALTRDLGVDWPKPTRITVVRDHLSLSAMTGLPYESARTTGTVAVAKWGRVTMLSPRASRHGFQWRDTLAHELTHLAVTRATADRAPLWLQEGVAKGHETRWRAPGPFDDRPPVDALVRRGMELKLDLPLDKLGPSIAMLPSADAAMVAFAEVTSFVRFYATTAGERALPRLFAELRSGKKVDEALVAASGLDLRAWDAKWRAGLGSEARDPSLARFGFGNEPKGASDARERLRLAELLEGRGHSRATLAELDKVDGALADDPTIRYVRGRALESLGRLAEAKGAVADPKSVTAPYGPWWALRGRIFRAEGDGGEADKSFFEALGIDPLAPETACGTNDPTSVPTDLAMAALCKAAREGGEPPLGRD
jgi:hypothetical protein